jgi:DNA processing protein
MPATLTLPKADGRAQATEDLYGPLVEHERKYAPEMLYVQGDTDLLRDAPRVSIVGSRKASPEGMTRAATLAARLVEQGVTIVSGLAEGIDTAAHKTAIREGGRTIAVIGTPLNVAYPKKNAELQAEIARNHLLVSQFRPDTPTRPHNFPQRNRTMALLTDATVIVEAGQKSGTIHQGWEALRLNRRLLVLESLAARGFDWVDTFIGYGAEVLKHDGIEAFADDLPAGRHFAELLF